MLPEYFVFISALIASLGGLQYLHLTLKGTVQPNKVSYFFWGVLPLIGFFAQQQQEVGPVMWVTLVLGVIPFVIIGASFINPAAHWKLNHLDYVLAVLTVCIMVIWYITNDSMLALVLAISADFLASLPTLLKSYQSPESEDWRPYALNAFGFAIGILAIQNWVFEEYSFIIYVFCMTLAIAVTILVRQKIKNL